MQGVTVLVGDSLRRDAVGIYGGEPTPFIDRIAHQSTVYWDHWSLGYKTDISLRGIFHEDRDWAGFKSSRFLRAIHNPSKGMCSFLFAGVHYATEWAHLFTYYTGLPLWRDEDLPRCMTVEPIVEAYARFLNLADFCFLHSFLVHRPYTIERMKDNDAVTCFDPGELLSWRENYRKAVVQFDQLAEIIYNMDRNRVLIITSDHGDELGEEGMLGHSRKCDETLRVPLLIHDPTHPVNSGTSVTTDHGLLMPIVVGKLGIDLQDPMEHRLASLGYV